MSLHYVLLEGCPCPKPLYPILRKLKAETGCTYNSLYRGDDVAALLHRNGKHTQRELFETLPPGQANPPDRGTHILLGDGVVGRLHERLPWWRCGIDVNDGDVPAMIAAARRHGWDLYQPYPSGSEFHHLNFRRKPTRWRAFFRHVFGGRKPAKQTGGIAPAVPAPAKEPKPPKKPSRKPVDRLGDMIDVSEAQGDVDWSKVATAVSGAIVKATEGQTFTDSRFNGGRLRAMAAAKLRIGVYHFARPDNNSAAAEVKHFVDTVHAAGGRFISYQAWKEGKPGVFAFLDFEHEPFSEKWAAEFGELFQKETGVKAGLYGYGSSLNPVARAFARFACLWFAAYVPDWRPFLNAHHARVKFWQHTDAWRCPGVSGPVDHSKYLGRG